MWVTFFDDQWAEQSTVELEPDVTVIKVRPGGFGTERVRERIAGSDRVLRYVRHAVDRIRDGNSVPVNRRLFLKVVGQLDTEYFTFLDAQLRTGEFTLVHPVGRRRLRGWPNGP